MGEQSGYGRPSPAASAEPVLGGSGGAWRAGWRAEGASTPWCALRAASVVGVRHRLAGSASDDCFAWAQTGPGDRLALAVADGVGGVSGSAGAAERACRAAVEAVAGEDTGAEAGVAAANEAAAEGDGATTLVLAVVDAGGAVALSRVGDSSAFLVEADGATRELFDPADDGEMAVTETAALPSGSPAAETVGLTLVAGEALVLATDGVAGPWRDGPQTVAPALGAALAGLPSPADLLGLVDFSRQGCHDDRTVAGLWFRGRDPA